MKYKSLILLTIITLLLACKKNNKTESRYSELMPFNKIEFNSPFDVYLNEDTNYYIQISGDKDIIENIEFYIENNTLKVENSSKQIWLTPRKNKVVLNINSKPLSQVKAKQTCNIQTITPITTVEFIFIQQSKANQATLELNCQKFKYWNDFPCGGNITLSGKSDSTFIWNYAIMSVNAKNLISNNAFVENSSKGNCEVTVNNKIEYSIFGSGNIILYGKPSEIIEKNISSSGTLIRY